MAWAYKDVKIAIIIMFKYFKKNMNIVRRGNIYFFQNPDGTSRDEKLSIWNEKFTVGIKSRIDTVEEKTSELKDIITEMIQDEIQKKKLEEKNKRRDSQWLVEQNQTIRYICNWSPRESAEGASKIIK